MTKDSRCTTAPAFENATDVPVHSCIELWLLQLANLSQRTTSHKTNKLISDLSVDDIVLLNALGFFDTAAVGRFVAAGSVGCLVMADCVGRLVAAGCVSGLVATGFVGPLVAARTVGRCVDGRGDRIGVGLCD